MIKRLLMGLGLFAILISGQVRAELVIEITGGS